MKRKLVFIHGRSQEGKNPEELKTQWLAALKEGLKKAKIDLPNDVEIAFPFYGDKLDELLDSLKAPLVSDVTDRGAQQDSTEAEFRGELLNEIAQGADITDARIQSHFKGDRLERGPLNWEWVQAILSALDGTPLGAIAIDAFTRDVYVYLTNRSVREAIDKIVSAALSDGTCVVVGHSLGSVVGYNVLRNTALTTRVVRYVTVGSPLGLKTIKQKLDTPLTMPECVHSWFNALDERDVVALYPLDADNFNIYPAIENKTDVDNQTANRHGIAGYLDDATVAKHIYDALRGG